MISLARGLNLVFGKGLCRIQFHEAASQNAISFEMAEALGKLCTSFSKGQSQLNTFLSEHNCGLVVLESRCEKVFVSGGNLKDLLGLSAEQGHQYTQFMREFCKSLKALPIPSLSLLAGPAYGGGTEIALATDFRAAVSDRAALHFWQTRWGVPGGWNGMARLSEIVPAWNSRKVGLLFAMQSSLSCADLLRNGICDFDFCTLTSEQIWIALEEIASRTLQCEPALRTHLSERGTANALTDEQLFDKFWLSPDHKARLREFMEKSSQKTSSKGS